MSTVSGQSSAGAGLPSGRHAVNIAHLVMGLALLGLVGVWAVIESDVVDEDALRWLLPVPWVVAGLVGLVATAVTGTRRYAVRQRGWVGAEPAVSTDSDEPQQDQPDDEPIEPHTSTEETR